jgi:hypothetical protein
MRSKLLVLGSAICVLSCFSLVLPVGAVSVWSQMYGGANDDVGACIVATPDGGYAVAGTTWSYSGGSEFWLVKVNSEGTMEWDSRFGNGKPGYQSNEAFYIVVTPDGGYALAGHTWSFGAGSADYWLVKTDASGNMQWSRTYGGSDVDRAEKVVVTSDGGYALVGRSYSFGNGTAWLVKTDASGNAQWNRTYEGTEGDDRARSVIATSDGGYALTGGTWFLKTDALGNVQWKKTYNEITTVVNETYSFLDFSGTYSLIATADGGYALSGWRYLGPVWILPPIFEPQLSLRVDERNWPAKTCSVELSEEISSALDETPVSWGLLLVKTDALGNTQWNRTYEGISVNSAPSLVATSDGGFVVASEGYIDSDGYRVVLLTKTDGFGNIQWRQTYERAGASVKANSLIATADGGFAIAGETVPGFSRYDAWVVKTDEVGVVPESFSLIVFSAVLIVAMPILLHKRKLLRSRP